MGKLEVRARQWVCRQIRSGRFPVDSYLPAVEDMAGKAGCGPATMRQALNELARESVVKSSKRWGTRVLRRPPTGKVCLVLSSDGDTNTLFHRPLSESLMKAGYDVDILPWYLDSRTAQDQLQRILSGGSPAECLVAISPESLSAGVRSRLFASLPRFSRKIFICIDVPPAIADVEIVHIDHQVAARKVITHLLELGHRQIGIAVATSLDSHGVHAQSARFCRDLCEVAGATFLPLTFVETRRKLIEMIQRKQITAFWDLNDHSAMLTSAFLEGAGFSIPRHLSLIGRNNPHPSARLTTVSLNPSATAKKVVQLLNRQDGKESDRIHLIEPELVIRQSTGPAHRNSRS